MSSRKSLSGTFLGIVALWSLGLASLPGHAHTYTLSLGEAAGATHYFGLICSEDSGVDTDRLLARVQTETVGGPLVTLLVHKDSVATSVTDLVNGDAEPSPTSLTPGGNGLYSVLISKTGPGAVAFSITVHCLDKTGSIHTGTDAVVYQYQPYIAPLTAPSPPLMRLK